MGNSRYNGVYPLRSWLNRLGVRLGYALKSNRVPGFPLTVHLEVTNLCNLRCPLCPTGKDAGNRPKGVMSHGNFQAIIDELKPYSVEMNIAGWGEPFLNKDIGPMVRYASEAGFTIHLYSNGLLIDTPEKIEAVLASGLQSLTVSIDGATQEIYGQYRVGGKLEVVLANLEALVHLKKLRGLKSPEIIVLMVVTRVNEAEVEQVRRMAEDLGVDSFCTRGAHLALTHTTGVREIPDELVVQYNPQSREYQAHRMTPEKRVRTKCRALYEDAFISWNGEVTTCCYDTGFLNSMGNIFEAGSFLKVWNGAKYRNLRYQVKTDIRQATPLCHKCPGHITIKPASQD